MTENPEKQSNIADHDKTVFDDVVFTALKSGGIHLTANKNFGKSFMLFSIVESLQKQESCRVIAFDGSEAWIYKASKIPVYTIGENDIIASNLRKTDEFEKYTLRNENLIKLALSTHKNILFRFKTKKPSKRSFLIRYVTCLLDEQQRTERDRSPEHEIKQCIAIVLDEAQDAFTNRSTARLEMEEFMCIFAEARNSRISFISSSQRLTDVSKAVRAKQLKVLGKLDSEDITPFLRKIEKAHNISFADMKPRTWYFEGQIFQSPDFKQSGKPYQINTEIRQKWLDSLPKPKTLTEKIKAWFTQTQKRIEDNRKAYVQQREQRINDDPSSYDYEPDTEETGESAPMPTGW